MQRLTAECSRSRLSTLKDQRIGLPVRTDGQTEKSQFPSPHEGQTQDFLQGREEESSLHGKSPFKEETTD